jgi:hypothetical protein
MILYVHHNHHGIPLVLEVYGYVAENTGGDLCFVSEEIYGPAGDPCRGQMHYADVADIECEAWNMIRWTPEAW